MNLISATHTIYEIDAEKCIGCRACVRKCPVDAISGELKELHTIDQALCIQCGTCGEVCRFDAVNAIEVKGRLRTKRKWDAWMLARRGVQFSLLALFFYLILNSSQTAFENPVPVNIFSRANVLQGVMSSIASRRIIVDFWPALIIVGITLVFGRAWCGWICPTGTIFDLYGFKDRVFKWQGLRYLKYVILAVLLVMAIFGSLAFMYFEPITVLIRGFVGGILPVAQSLIAGVPVDWTKVAVVASVLLIFALLANIVERRFWCRYICPLGASIGLLSKFSLFKRKVNNGTCVTCGHCTPTCPMGAISHDDFETDPAECIVCMDCVPSCPTSSIAFETVETLPQWGNEFDPTRREAFLSLGLGAAGVIALKSGVNRDADPNILRPPGVYDNKDFLAMCIRCDQCVQACEQGLIVPAVLEAGWDAVSTPIVQIDGKFCDYDCNSCTQVCPSEAIPHLTLEEKRLAPIGIVVIDEEDCIECMICEDACPASAIEREEYMGKYRHVQAKPVVNQDLCVGCNICTFECPKDCMKVVSRNSVNL